MSQLISNLVGFFLLPVIFAIIIFSIGNNSESGKYSIQKETGVFI